MMQEHCRLPFLQHLKPILVVSFIVLVHIVEDRYVVRAGIFRLQTSLGILLISDMGPTDSFHFIEHLKKSLLIEIMATGYDQQPELLLTREAGESEMKRDYRPNGNNRTNGNDLNQFFSVCSVISLHFTISSLSLPHRRDSLWPARRGPESSRLDSFR